MFNKRAMKELKSLLIKNYPHLIDKVILYGSRAENKDTEYSDYDILLILKTEIDRKMEENVLDIAYDIILKYDIMTDLKMISNDDLRTIKGCLPYVRAALNKGIEL